MQVASSCSINQQVRSAAFRASGATRAGFHCRYCGPMPESCSRQVIEQDDVTTKARFPTQVFPESMCSTVTAEQAAPSA